MTHSLRTPNPLLEHLYSALHSPHGIILHTTGDPRSLKANLYSVRKRAGDPALAALFITDSPTSERELWIVKKQVAQDAPQ